MHLIFTAHCDPKEPLTKEPVRNRLAAKKELWDFVNELSDPLIKTQLEDEDMVIELTQLCIRYLHPFYTGEEIMRESHQVLISFNFHVAFDLFTNKFIPIYTSYLSGKVKIMQRK